MRSLDKFYKYLENREAGETIAEKPPAEAAEADRPGVPPGLRYVIRNGVTVAVAPEETAGKQPTPVPKDDPAPYALEVDHDVAAALEIPVLPDRQAEDGAVWQSLPENVRRLAQLSSDLLPGAAPQAPERRQLIERLLNPLLSLEDTARLLGVCTATVRRYANKGALAHHRTIGQQRRFLLSDVLALLESRKPSHASVSPPEETP
ncbi:MAG: helix-turn-helix domain-containing protein [Armatimonadota bacterium]